MISRPRLWPPLLGLALLAASTACAASGASGRAGGNRIVTPPPETRPLSGTPVPSQPLAIASQTPASAARVRGEALSAGELRVAYQALLDTYVDPVDGEQLIQVAEDTLRKSLADQASLPMLTVPVALVPAATGDPSKDWQSFGDAYDAVVGKLPGWVDDKHPDWSVLRSMADSLHDGHTTFLTPDEVKRRGETSFAGIGVLLAKSENNKQPLVGEVFPNSPAAAGGLKRGDRILAVEGQDLLGKSVADVALLIRGANGSTVHLKVERHGAPAPLDVAIKRAVVQVEQVAARQVGSLPIGYLRIRGFGSPQVADNALGMLQAGQQQRGIKAWILDLRGNSGGDLNTVLAVASGFLDQSHTVVGYEVDRQRHQSALNVDPLDLVKGDKVVVLVDKDTVAGAEIMAAALQEAGVGTLVGTKSAGNVGVASQIPFSDGSVLQVTNHRFVSPSGAQLDGVGVTPDVEVAMTDDDLINDTDPQLAKALEIVAQALGLVR